MMTTGQKVMLGLGLGAVAYAIYSAMSKKEAKAYMSMDTAGGGRREALPPSQPAIPIASVIRQYAPSWDGSQWVVTGDIKTVQGQVITRSTSVAGKPNVPPSQAAIMAALLAPSRAADFEL